MKKGTSKTKETVENIFILGLAIFAIIGATDVCRNVWSFATTPSNSKELTFPTVDENTFNIKKQAPSCYAEYLLGPVSMGTSTYLGNTEEEIDKNIAEEKKFCDYMIGQQKAGIMKRELNLKNWCSYGLKKGGLSFQDYQNCVDLK